MRMSPLRGWGGKVIAVCQPISCQSHHRPLFFLLGEGRRPRTTMAGKSMPAERTKAVDNVHRMVVEVIEVIEAMEIAVAKDDGWTVDLGAHSSLKS